MTERPSDGYRNAITDPDEFVGRESLLERIRLDPRALRVLLGGRRIGKTSLLLAIEWRLLRPDFRQPLRAFPVYLNLQREQPRSLDHWRYLLVMRLRQAIARWEQVSLGDPLAAYRAFQAHVAEVKVGLDFLVKLEVKLDPRGGGSQEELSNETFVTALVATIAELRRWQVEGICFLVDEADYIVRQTWSSDAWGYVRTLKDVDTALKPFVGFIVSGYRDLKHYRQPAGSPLNNAKVEWLSAFTEDESRDLAQRRSGHERIALSDRDLADVLDWAGAHPFLTQQLLNALFNGRAARVQGRVSSEPAGVGQAATFLLRDLSARFADWWGLDGGSDGFGDDERSTYRALVEQRQADAATLAQRTRLSEGRVLDALDVLVGNGVVLCVDEDHWAVGARLFEYWVERHDPAASTP